MAQLKGGTYVGGDIIVANDIYVGGSINGVNTISFNQSATANQSYSGITELGIVGENVVFGDVFTERIFF